MRSKVHPKYTTKYRVGNWSAYEQALVQRGDVTLWLSADATDAWRPSPSGRPGAPKTFSDCAIETALTLRLVFRVPLRQAEGFLRSVLSLMGVDLEAPDHTTLSRRSQSLAVEFRRIPSRGPQVAGVLRKVKYVVATMPYSNVYFAKAYPVERLESLLDGIQAAFAYMGGVTDRVVLDNTTIAVKQVLTGRDRVQTDAFQAFRGAYPFAAAFCAPATGWEKGSVETGVTYVRNLVFRPRPTVASWAALNALIITELEADVATRRLADGRPVREAWTLERRPARLSGPVPDGRRVDHAARRSAAAGAAGPETRPARPLRRGHRRRARLRAVRQGRRRPAVRLHQPPLRAREPRRHNQSAVRPLVRGVPGCGVRRSSSGCGLGHRSRQRQQQPADALGRQSTWRG